MIEAVNSVLSNAQFLRESAGKADAARSLAANPERTQEIAAPKAPYISPYISVDVNFDTAVLQIRDSNTGDVVNQYPSESRLQQRQRAARQDQSEQLRAAPEAPSQQDTNSSANIGVSEIRGGAPDVAQAQAASRALSNGAQAGVQNLSAGVSVDA
mgnify:CR=1 FL=1